MIVKSLKLINFRNYEKAELSFSPKTNILLGNNAAGKTNILEALYVLSLGRSYKNKDKEMIENEKDYLKINALVELKDREDSVTFIASNVGKKVFVNEREITKLSEFIGHLNTVLFSPEDLLLLKNGPQEKRKLMDMSLLQISKQYVEDYQAFKKQLKLRNDYLKYLYPKTKEKDDIEDDMLDILTMNFIDCNKRIFEARNTFLKNLEAVTDKKYRELSGSMETVTFEYIVNFENDIVFYKEKYKSDITQGSTQFGCHRDDIIFKKNGQNFETNASQGEGRMLALSIKLALAEMIERMKREAPVLLLDDVFSELDKNHQNRLLSMLSKSMQTIITTTDILKIGKSALENAKIFTVTDGRIKETNYGRN